MTNPSRANARAGDARGQAPPPLNLDAVREAWVLHRGALGDSVLTWPVLRHLVKSGVVTTLAADRAKAELAAACVGVHAADAESPDMLAIWRPEGAVRGLPGVDLVLDYEHAASPLRDARLRRMFPRASVVPMPQPRGGRSLRAFVDAHPLARVDARANADGPVVLHVGAGSEAKRWPMERWCDLHERLCDDGKGVVVIAGEVERERFSRTDTGFFQRMGGRWIDTLPALRDLIAGARALVGNDSGPTHLAAQLGVPTTAIFGATDAREWAPVGGHVRVVGRMGDRPSVDEVQRAVLGSLRLDPV
ncbi:MAG: glycosyltransferase family 9 protein [Phycisphaerae bacterium]|nr:glycosyltransferase family 9 protein [Phycisphaerae bacterium]